MTDDTVCDLMNRLFYGARCGMAAAEFNLAEAGLIEMIQGHQRGVMRADTNWRCDFRWTLSECGRRASAARLERA